MEALAPDSVWLLPPSLTQYDQVILGVADGCDPPSGWTASDTDLMRVTRSVLRGRLVPVLDEEGRAPLYISDSEGGWQRSEHYNATAAREWIAQETYRCLTDLFYFATHYCYTLNGSLYDTTGKAAVPELVPGWFYVAATLNELATPADTVIEKSRDMMASWLCMVAVLHDLVFRSSWAVLTASRLQELVDDGGEASSYLTLHGKVRYMHQRLPPFLRLASPLIFKSCHIRNPVLDNFCVGFAATGDIGRAGKFKRAVLDEFAMLEHSEEVMAAVTNACPVGKILNSTPRGKTNAFYRIRELARGVWPVREDKPGHWKRITLHWSQHPERDQAWYDTLANSGSMTAEKLAIEVDISYERSVGGRVYPKFVRDLHVMGGTLCDADATYQPSRALCLCMDFNHDPLVWVLLQAYPSAPPFRVVGEIVRRSATYEDAINEFVVRFGKRSRVDWLLKRYDDWTELYTKHGICQAGDDGHHGDVLIYGDATEEASNLHSRVKPYQMIQSALKQHGFRVKMHVPSFNPPVIHRIETFNDALSKRLLVMHPSAVELIKDCEGGVWDTQQNDMNQRKLDDDGSGLTRSHASSAVGYYLVQKHRVATSGQQAQSRVQMQNISAMVARW